jgi:PHP family Zn ribbon phosphoesterase
MLNCECGFNYNPTEAEKSLASITCPNCKRKIKKGETWIHPIGEMNMLEAKKAEGRELEYLRQRKIKNGY